MLENEFFPTPHATIREMVYFSGYQTGTKETILDPNGGSGAILDYVKNLNKTRYDEPSTKNYFTLEINPDLKYTLQGKGYKVLGYDFLEYDEPTVFDYIFMNPPFSNGDDHVLKAYEHLNDGGTLVALLNAQTIKNPYSRTRQNLIRLLCKSFNETLPDWLLDYIDNNLQDVLKQLENNKRIKWLGRCFKDAERSTNVEVVMIKITKPKGNFSFDFGEINFDLDAEAKNAQCNPNTLASKDVVRDLVARYNAAKKILLDRYEAQQKLDFYLQGISTPVYGSVDKGDRYNSTDKPLENIVKLNEQLLYLKSCFWNTVFIKTEIGNKATSNFKKKFEQFTIQQSAIAFTEENVKEVLYLFIANMGDMMKDCVIEVFDKATSYHEKNQIHHEGWKTNKSWKLNKRIILPNGIRYDNKYRDSFAINEYQSDFLHDLDRVVFYLSGKKCPENLYTYNGSSYKTISHFCYNHKQEGKNYSEEFENEFFKFKIFKKGTLHIDFKDLKILEQINRIAAEGKNWIGQGC
jgi:hypothetical protein